MKLGFGSFELAQERLDIFICSRFLSISDPFEAQDASTRYTLKHLRLLGQAHGLNSVSFGLWLILIITIALVP